MSGTNRMVELGENEIAVYRRLQTLGGVTNVHSLQTDATETDALRRLIQLGLVRPVGYVVEIIQASVEESVRKPDRGNSTQMVAAQHEAHQNVTRPPEAACKKDETATFSMTEHPPCPQGSSVGLPLDGEGKRGNSKSCPMESLTAGLASTTRCGRSRRSYVERSLFAHLPPIHRLAARILWSLDYHGRMTKRDLERRMNRSKCPLWPQAWELLLTRNCIQVSATGNRRQQMITLREIPRDLEPHTIIKRRKRKRPPTRWFKDHLAKFLERDGY
jgi:hypothetical protein